MTNYQKQATDFLTKTETTFEAKFLKNDFYFSGDKEKRDIYEITLTRGDRKVILNFGQSLIESSKLRSTTNFTAQLNKSQLEALRGKLCDGVLTKETLKNYQLAHVLNFPKAPTPYCILAGLQKYDVGTFENFCDEFGYDSDSKSAEKIYLAAQKEFADVQRLWTDKEIEELQEIN